MKKNAETEMNFECKYCDFVCSKQSNYSKHLSTRKHIVNAEGYKKMPENAGNIECECECGKKYAFLSGLWRHKKICKNVKQSTSKNILQKLINDSVSGISNSGNSNSGNINSGSNSDNSIAALTNLVMTVVQCNIDLQKQNNEYHARNMELAKNTFQYNTVISNNNNKTFNLNFFLNEQCKNAMNMVDFVDTFKLHLNDLEHVGKQGYIEGISEIIIKKLNEMDIYKRPIHCSDAKRETIFVKDANVWERESENRDKLRGVVKNIAKKNSDMLPDWIRINNPLHTKTGDCLHDNYVNIVVEAMGGKGDVNENDNKIIKKISRTVLIEKEISDK